MDSLNMNTLTFSSKALDNSDPENVFEADCFENLDDDTTKFSVKLDYLSFSLSVGASAGIDLPGVVKCMLFAGNSDYATRLIFEEAGGWQGYKSSARLVWVQDVGTKKFHKIIGLIAFGGVSQRGRVYVSFSGVGCDVVSIEGLSWLVANFERLKVSLTRVDIALDDFSGRNTIQSTLRRYKRGQFSNRKATTKFQYIQKGETDTTGETIYIGTRASGKMCRIYEKGRQLGDPNSRWVRVEIQFGSHQRKLPPEMLLDPLPFALGAYPAISKMFPCNVLPSKITTIRVAAKISLKKALSNLRKNSGPMINTLLEAGVSGRNLITVLNKVGSNVPKRLAASGIDQAIRLIGLDSPGLKSSRLYHTMGELTAELDSMCSHQASDDQALCFSNPELLFGRERVTVTSIDGEGRHHGQ